MRMPTLSCGFVKKEQGKGSCGVVSPYRENKLSVRAMWSGGVITASGTMVSVSNF